MQFTTVDQDQDLKVDWNCAQTYDWAGWWYSDCFRGNLNGGYYNRDRLGRGIIWEPWKLYSLMAAEMKVKPVTPLD
jgi:hypothetical protein